MKKIKTTKEVLAEISKLPKLLPNALGIDLNGTIDEAPNFFSFLSKMWNGPVYIITLHEDHEKVVQYLELFDIKVDGIILARNCMQKAQYIKKLNIIVYFDDMDEVLTHIPSNVSVFKMRNKENFDFKKMQWFNKKVIS